MSASIEACSKALERPPGWQLLADIAGHSMLTAANEADIFHWSAHKDIRVQDYV
jgi:hypothetical protein